MVIDLLDSLVYLRYIEVFVIMHEIFKLINHTFLGDMLLVSDKYNYVNNLLLFIMNY